MMKYEPTGLDEIVVKSGLNPDYEIGLWRHLQRYRELFNGNLCVFNMKPYDIGLPEEAKRYYLERA